MTTHSGDGCVEVEVDGKPARTVMPATPGSGRAEFMKYEPTAVEFEGAPLPVEQWSPLQCIHCGKSIGYHWQTADGKLFCAREVTASDAKGVTR